MFATDVSPIIKMNNFKMRKPSLEDIFKDMDDFTYESKYSFSMSLFESYCIHGYNFILSEIIITQ